MGPFYHKKGLSHPVHSHAHIDVESGVAGLRSQTRRRCKSAFGKEGSGEGKNPEFAGVLFTSVSGAQEGRLVQTRVKRIGSEQVCPSGGIQARNAKIHKRRNTTGRLGGFVRSERRVLSYPDPPKLPEVSTLLCKRDSVSIPLSPVWDFHGPQGLHEDHGGRGSLYQASRSLSSPVFRRLATSESIAEITHSPISRVLEDSDQTGTYPQRREVRNNTVTNIYVCGDGISDSVRDSQATVETSRKLSTMRKGRHGPTSRIRKRISFSTRCSEFGGRLGPTGQTSHEAYPVGTATCVVPEEGVLRGPDISYTPNVQSPSVVAGCGSSFTRGTHSSTQSGPVSVYRCQSRRVGSTFGANGSGFLRFLGQDNPSTPYKQSRTACNKARVITSRESSSQSYCADSNGQYDGGLVHSSPGGNSVSLALSSYQGTTPVVSGQGDRDSSPSHPGAIQCSSGQVVPLQLSTTIRVVAKPGGSGTGFSPGRLPHDGSVCHEIQQQTPVVCLSGTRCVSMGGGRNVHILEKSVPLCFSTAEVVTTGSTQSTAGSLQVTPSSPVLAAAVLVSDTAQSVGRLPACTATVSGPAVTSRRSVQSPRRARSESTRLDHIQRRLREKKFSLAATQLISQSRRASTRSVYDAKWKIFSNWCRGRRIDPVHPSSPEIADFLIFLFQEKKYQMSTIKGYRSAIANTLKFRKGGTVGSDPYISELIRAMEIKRPRVRNLTPKWNLACVLEALVKTPYEPLGAASLMDLTVKTVFLLSLATAGRRSELHALSVEPHCLRFSDSDGSVQLLCRIVFLAKNRLPSVPPSPFIVPSLSQSCGSNDPDRLLCPVRALKFYLAATEAFRGSRKRLFLPVRGLSDISPATISRWIVSVIKSAYAHISSTDLALLRINAHEVRAISTSCAFLFNSSCSDVIQSVYWRGHSTFSSFYLRDLSVHKDDLYSLGPFVCAQRVIQTGRGEAGN